MLIPVLMIALGSVLGAGGIASAAKGTIDSINASATNRKTQERNEKNLLDFQAYTDAMENTLEDLGKNRFIITKNYKYFTEAFSKIHNKPTFTELQSTVLPQIDINEITNISVVANDLLGTAVGTGIGTAFAAAAATGTTAAVMALGTASTGTKIAALHGAAATRAALAALGGGSLAAGGGGIALGTLVLNVASVGVGALFEGLALAYTGSKSRKAADKAYGKMLENEKIIFDAIDMQKSVTDSAVKIKKATIQLTNGLYKEYVFRMRDLVEHKSDWTLYSDEEMLIVENTILIIQLLQRLNNTALYKVTKMENDEVTEAEANTEEINQVLHDTEYHIEQIKNNL